jgi:hypothetical protein
MKMDFLDGVEVPNHPTEDSGFDEAFFNAHGLTDDYCALLQTLSSRPKTQVEPSIRFFNYAPSEQKVIDWLIAFGNAPTGWTPKAAYPHISCDPEILASALNLTDVELWYSSVDFEGECWLTESPDTVKEIHALARKAAPDWPTDLGLMRAGVNFTANAHFFPHSTSNCASS